MNNFGLHHFAIFVICCSLLVINCLFPYDISAKNPNSIEVIEHKEPLEIVESIKENNLKIYGIMNHIEELLKPKEKN